jgi:hypothetical protein
MTRTNTGGVFAALQDLPLPGHYPCLTLQLNATLYPGIGEVKYVLVLREPVAQLELGRIGGQARWDTQVPRIEEALHRSLQQALYLGGLTQGTES